MLLLCMTTSKTGLLNRIQKSPQQNSKHPTSFQTPTLHTVGPMEATSKAFLLFFLLPDWLKLNHLKSRMECGFSDIFSRHTCSTIAKPIGVTNYAASFGAKNVQKTIFEAAEMILGPWNQQISKNEKITT